MEEKIVIAIASGRGEVPLDFMTAIIDMILETKRKFPKISIATLTCKQTYIHQARQILAEAFLETDGDRLLCIDDDNIPAKDHLIKLLEMDLPIASGLYFKRRAPFEPIIMLNRRNGKGSERRPDIWKNGITEPFEVHSTGFGFILIKREVFAKMRELGVPMFDMRGGVGEDIWFCIQAQSVGYKIIINPAVEVGHLGDKVLITGKDYRDYYQTNIQNKIDRALTVDGWMTEKELEVLANEAVNCDYTIEVGSWKGRSAVALSLSKKLWCVDKFDGVLDGGPKETKEQTGKDFFENFKENTKGLDNIIVVRGDSIERSKDFQDYKVDLVFIDGGHTTEEALADMKAYWEKIRIGGKMMIHDHSNSWKSVVEAVERFNKEYLSVSTGRLIPETTIYEIVKL